MTLAQAQALIPGSQLVGDGGLALQRVHTDTRTLRPGDLYVALRGERFDGHDFLAQARASGAVAVLASHGLGPDLPGLLVPDTLLALQQLAAGHRQHCVLPLVAVVGSNGKTTVTQMLAAILRAWQGDAALATAGNLNNHIGVPLTLLHLHPDPQPNGAAGHRAAVLELGMNHPGEIALLARLAAPTVVVVNNAQREHQEFMASVQAVAEENGSAINALGADGVVVLPADDAYLPLWQKKAGSRKVLTFGLQAGADVVLQVQDADTGAAHAQLPRPLQLHTPLGTAHTTLHLPGQHNLHNAAAAAAAALAAGAPLAAVAQGLADFRSVAGRSQVLQLQRGGQAVTLAEYTITTPSSNSAHTTDTRLWSNTVRRTSRAGAVCRRSRTGRWPPVRSMRCCFHAARPSPSDLKRCNRAISSAFMPAPCRRPRLARLPQKPVRGGRSC